MEPFFNGGTVFLAETVCVFVAETVCFSRRAARLLQRLTIQLAKKAVQIDIFLFPFWQTQGSVRVVLPFNEFTSDDFAPGKSVLPR